MKRTAMGMVKRPQARVALFHFLESVQWSGPWQSVGDGHCGIYAHSGCYSLPTYRVRDRRRRIAGWIRRNDSHSVHRWSDQMGSLEPLPLRGRRALMRKEAKGVLKGAWLGAPSMQALSCLSGEPVVILHERLLTTADSDFRQGRRARVLLNPRPRTRASALVAQAKATADPEPFDLAEGNKEARDRFFMLKDLSKTKAFRKDKRLAALATGSSTASSSSTTRRSPHRSSYCPPWWRRKRSSTSRTRRRKKTRRTKTRRKR